MDSSCLLTFLNEPDVNAADAYDALREEGVETVGDLALLNEQDLASLGVRLGPRKRIICVIQKLQGSGAQDGGTTAAGDHSPASGSFAASAAARLGARLR